MAKPAAIRIAAKCEGKPGTVTEESRPSTQIAPLLYDLTSLQREANGRFGFSARTTLSLAQSLYEKHKALTYPRTDARALPEDYLGTVTATMEALKEASPYRVFATQILKQKWVKPNRRIFDNSKISDHFAIIPTLVVPKHLNELEAKLYDFVVKRFLAAFYPPAEFTLTTRITRVAGEPFKSEGKVMVAPGWLAVYGKEAQSDEGTLTPVAPGETVATEKIEVAANQTRPPARFNEATLLSAMECAGKLIDDEELREAMREKGLGTPATRASIIEGLIFEDYVHRVARELHPTAKAFDLLYALDKFGIDELRSPELTGTWEFKLKQMEQGRLRREEFMEHIVETTRDLVERVKRGTLADDTISTLTVKCPKDGGTVNENYKKFQCASCDFAIWKVIAGRRIENEEVEQLIREAAIGPLQGFRSRIGRPVRGDAEAARGLHRPARLRPERPGRAQRGAGRLLGENAARPLPEMRRAHLRPRTRLPVRAFGRPRADLRLPFREDHPATGDRAGADGEAAGDRAHRSPAPVHLEEGPAVLGVPGTPAGRQGRVRVRPAPGEEDGGQGRGRQTCPRARAKTRSTARAGRGRRAQRLRAQASQGRAGAGEAPRQARPGADRTRRGEARSTHQESRTEGHDAAEAARQEARCVGSGERKAAGRAKRPAARRARSAR
jgi:hypothetical protein